MTDADYSDQLLSGWDRGDRAEELRSLVESAASRPEERETACKVAGSTSGWQGLWVARIEHFEKVAFTGLRVRPHYEMDNDGRIVSHVHATLGPFRGWGSASGVMRPASDGSDTVQLRFDDFWLSSGGLRTAPDGNGLDAIISALGRALFFEGLSGFPVDYAAMPAGLVAFRFTPFDSCIVARRAPDGEKPREVDA